MADAGGEDCEWKPCLDELTVDVDVENDWQPPLDAQYEPDAPADTELRDACVTMLGKMGRDYRLSAERFSRSNRWGAVFRIDFVVLGAPSGGGLNRAMCWRDPTSKKVNFMFAMGESIPPLQNSK